MQHLLLVSLCLQILFLEICWHCFPVLTGSSQSGLIYLQYKLKLQLIWLISSLWFSVFGSPYWMKSENPLLTMLYVVSTNSIFSCWKEFINFYDITLTHLNVGLRPNFLESQDSPNLYISNLTPWYYYFTKWLIVLQPFNEFVAIVECIITTVLQFQRKETES